MPRAPKQCGIQGCTTIVPAGTRCDDHKHGWKSAPRSPSADRTNTAHWKKQRALALERDRDRCQIRGPRCTYWATQVDHYIPVYRGGTDDLDNLDSVCKPCHDSKTAAEARAARG